MTDSQVQTHKNKGIYLQIQTPKESDGRGKKRKFSDADMKIAKRELKKKKQTPKKVARRLSGSAKFGKTICEKTIRNRLKLKGNRFGKIFIFLECNYVRGYH